MAADLSLRLADLPPRRRYKILCGLVVPRPIALVSTVDTSGTVNAAPFSFFNLFSDDPPQVVLGLAHRPDDLTKLKDTARNIHATGEFVVNLVDEALAEAMNVCAVDFPPGVSEIEAAGLATAPSVAVKPPRIASAPAALECRKSVSLVFSPEREILVGEVLHVHVKPHVADAKTLDVDYAAYRPVGRLFGDYYSRQHDVFALKRLDYADWIKQKR